ncbi:COG3127 Predicted ABC-type transport system involved in lysophospholipase L1 biosynthesis, permease component [Oxalobacteraceae bacterium]
MNLLRCLLIGEWRAHPVRALVAILAIALGVALGFGIHLVNSAAFNEFSAAARSLSGSADLQARAIASSVDEQVFPQLANLAEVEFASPVLELDLPVPGQRSALKLLGIDSFAAATITPDLLGVPESDHPFDALMHDTVFLSPAAMQWLNLKRGDTLQVLSGTREVKLRVAGSLLQARAGQRLAVMDIGSAQWKLDRVGQISRVDLKLVAGVDRVEFRKKLQAQFADTLVVNEADDQDQRSATMSRAYRVNLNVLALVALFTGAFLVFSTQALSVLRRRPQLALLRTLGVTRHQLIRQILVEGTTLGVIGALLGIALGFALASAALSLLGGDLGGGYFPGVQPRVHFSPLAALVFFIAGAGVALLGSMTPALEAARAQPAAALKAGSEDLALAPLSTPWPALSALLLGALFTQLPPLAGLPIFGYLAIVLLLVGSIALMPRSAAWLFHHLSRRWQGVTAGLALTRLANAPNQAAIALGGVLASFSLMVAMAIMVASFRVSVDDWLQHLLSADIYVRVAGGHESARLNQHEQAAIAALPAVARAERTRWLYVSLDPARPTVALIARSINADDPERVLPLVGESLKQVDHPVWISEAMVDLYGWRLGQTVSLPFDGKLYPFTVAGIWRDYARQTGALQIKLSDYQQLSGDPEVSDMSLWLTQGSDITSLRAQLEALPFSAALEFAEPNEIRAISLRIFDRSFVITYLLEGVAILIGLFGVAATFSSQVLSRAKEFGMLRHLGITRRQILLLLAGEGALLATLAIVAGFVVGTLISLILVFIVNPQSFHWTMQLHLPWGLLASVAAAMLLSAALTALMAGKMAVAGSAVRAVREDW